MKDTSEDIRQKQLEIWLSKPVGERLRQTLLDNDALYSFWSELKKNNKEHPNTADKSQSK